MLHVSCVAQCSTSDENHLNQQTSEDWTQIAPADATQHKTQQVVDAETQCESLSKRSISTQTLTIRKPRQRIISTNPSSSESGGQHQPDSFDHLVDHNYSVSFIFPESSPMTPIQPTVSVETNTFSKASDVKQSSENNEYLSSDSSNCQSDTDDEYVCFDAEESCSSENEELNNERKFIVFESKLDQLFLLCKTCGSLCEIKKSHTGSMVTVKSTCSMNHTSKWTSQPEINETPAGNIVIPAAVLFTGGTFESTRKFSEALNLNFVNKDQFYNVQRSILFPVINSAYEVQQQEVINKVSKQKEVNLCGDGRSDSPGHNAKYGTYSLMDESSDKIVDFSLVHVSEVSSSNVMENEGCQRSLNKVIAKNVKIRSLTTDRHTQITSELRKKYPSIIHQYDVWHLSKWVNKKLTKKAKKKGNEVLFQWVQSISNHLWWCAQSCKGDPELLRRKWVAVLHHVVNEHRWKEERKVHKCEHHKLSKNKVKKTTWLEAGSPAHIALEEIVLNKKLLKDMSKLTEFHHTGNLEVYHSLLLKYAPKRQHFSYAGMVARTQLAVMDHNHNTGRKQATIKKGRTKGDNRYKLVFPKGRKKWVVKPVVEEKSFGFIADLMKDVVSHKKDGAEIPSSTPTRIPQNIATEPRPCKDEVVQAHKTRMGKIILL